MTASDEDIIEQASQAFSEQNFTKAHDLIMPLVADGNAAATGLLGLAYQHGAGVDIDPDKAVQLFQKAVELGDAYAAHNLGRLYMQGMQGLEADNELSNIYYALAREMGMKYEADS